MDTDWETTGPRRRRFTRLEYEHCAELGFFGPEERLELIGGEVFEKMSPQKGPHATAICLVEAVLRRVHPTDGVVTRVQLPLALGDAHEPEPDLAVVAGNIRDFTESHPKSALLVVEVAETTLKFDREVKGSMYAAAGIPCYWLINLVDCIVEVHRAPAVMAGTRFGWGYRELTRHLPGGQLEVGGVGVAVNELLP